VLNTKVHKRAAKKARRGRDQKDITTSIISRGIQTDEARYCTL